MIAPVPYFVPGGASREQVAVSCGGRVHWVSADEVYRKCLRDGLDDDCPPLVKGGQGRTDEDVTASASGTWWLFCAAACAAVAVVLWSLLS